MAPYCEAVAYKNISTGFQRCDIWCNIITSAYPSIITTDSTKCGGYSEKKEEFTSYLDLVDEFKPSRDLFRSNGGILNNGQITTTSGALLTSQQVLTSLEQRDE